MKLFTAIQVILAIFTNVSASLLLKMASLNADTQKTILLQTKTLILGGSALLAYGASFVLYALVLRDLPVSKAYLLITFGVQVVLVIVGTVYLGEQYDLLSWLGVLLVVLGLILVARGTI